MVDTFNSPDGFTTKYYDTKDPAFDHSHDNVMDYGGSDPINSQDMYLNDREDMYHLEFWDKLGLMAIGTTIVCVTLFIVVCTVGPGCCIYNLISMHLT